MEMRSQIYEKLGDDEAASRDLEIAGQMNQGAMTIALAPFEGC